SFSGLASSPMLQATVSSFLGDDAQAIGLLVEATQKSFSAPILIQLGKLQMKAQSFMAVIAFSKAIKVNPCHAEAYHQRGVCHARLQQPESLQDLNRSLTIDPSLFQVYLSRAAFYGAKGFYSKAILNCNEAISIQPNSTRAYLYRGALKIRLKVSKATFIHQCSLCFHANLQFTVQALRDYGITLLLPGPKQLAFKTLVNRALLYTELNDPCNALELQESVKAYTQAMRFHPFFLEAYVGRGNALMDYGHNQARKQAQRDYLSALHLDPLCQSARICLAYNFQVFGRFQWAWNQFTVAAELTPRNWAAFEGRAVVNLQMGSMYAAFQDISSALKVAHTYLFTNRGVINQLMGDKVNAMRDYKKAISLIPSYALAYFNAANLYFYNRQFEQACEYYSRAVELDPQDESALLNRAITLSLLRKVPEALSDFSLALELNPSFAHVFLNRANLYCSLKEYQLAEKDLNDALRLQPSDALLYKLRSEVRGHLGLTQQALQDYETALELHGDLET
uniref:Tetratricopeptide repeat domain 6 n=1 Tax=Denticeps clupeoides TaxID=299321 RepID=A0AAY3ZWU0_9TELE